MPVQTFDAQDQIPEEHRAAALETKDGKFAVFVEPDTTGLKSALEKERNAAKAEAKARKELEQRLAALEEERQANAAGLTKDKLEEIRKQAEAKFAADLAERDALKQQLRALRLDSAVKAQLSKAEFVDPEVAWRIVADQFDLTDDGTPVVKADPTKALDKHIADLAQQYPYLVRGTQAAGGAARGNAGGSRPAAGDDVLAWTPDQRAEFVQRHGLGSYQEKLDAAMLARATKQKAA